MTWHLLMTQLTVKDGERALLTHDGRLERVLEPGRHRLFDPHHQLTTELFNVPTSYTDNYQYILNVNPQVVQDRTKIYTQFKAG